MIHKLTCVLFFADFIHTIPIQHNTFKMFLHAYLNCSSTFLVVALSITLSYSVQFYKSSYVQQSWKEQLCSVDGLHTDAMTSASTIPFCALNSESTYPTFTMPVALGYQCAYYSVSLSG